MKVWYSFKSHSVQRSCDVACDSQDRNGNHTKCHTNRGAADDQVFEEVITVHLEKLECVFDPS